MNNKWIENQIKNFSDDKKKIVANCFDKLNSLELSGTAGDILINIIRNDINKYYLDLNELITIEEEKIEILKSNPVSKSDLNIEETVLFVIKELSKLSLFDIDKILDILSFKNTLVLQGTDDEWGVENYDGTQQNKIDFTVFRKNKDNSTAFTINAAAVTYNGGKHWYSDKEHSNKSITFPYKPEKKKKIYLKTLLNGDCQEIEKDDPYNLYIRKLYEEHKDDDLCTFKDVLNNLTFGSVFVSVNSDIPKVTIKSNGNDMVIENQEGKEIQINEFIRFIKVK